MTGATGGIEPSGNGFYASSEWNVQWGWGNGGGHQPSENDSDLSGQLDQIIGLLEQVVDGLSEGQTPPPSGEPGNEPGNGTDDGQIDCEELMQFASQILEVVQMLAQVVLNFQGLATGGAAAALTSLA